MKASLTALWLLIWALPPVLVGNIVQPLLLLEWSASGLAAGLLVLCVYRRLLRNSLLAIPVFAFSSISVLTAISFYMQGSMPDLQFFSHFDFGTLRIAASAYTAAFFGAFAYVLLLPLSVVLMGKWRPSVPSSRRILAPFLVFLIGFSFAPAHAIAFYVKNQIAFKREIRAEYLNRIQRPDEETSGSPEEFRNLILIYAESLEQTYFDDEVFPGLMTQMKSIREGAVWFSDIRQYPGTGWTVAGMVASQCGIPLISRTHGNQILASFEDPFADVTCLAEFLEGQGYLNTYIGGASLDFAGKGAFLKSNGYDLVLGRNEFPPTAQANSWGLYDDRLLYEAEDIIKTIADADRPFLVTLLTLDTHHPYGHPSPSCRDRKEFSQDILAAVDCSDRLLSDFVRSIVNSPLGENTVVAVVSDHLAMRNTAWSQLNSKERRLLFMILGTPLKARKIETPGSHFDIGPTLLEAMGFHNKKLGLGRSLLSNSAGGVIAAGLEEQDIASMDISYLFPKIALPQEVWSDGNQLSIGSVSFAVENGRSHGTGPQNPFNSKGFLAVAVDLDKPATPYVTAQRDEFRESFGDDPRVLWVLYDDGTGICFARLDCYSEPHLIVARGDASEVIARVGRDHLKIGAGEVRDFIAEFRMP